ncbi:MAG: DUF1344 domain-containing protein [Oricola sp.]|nr:MAG: DUF1344 domain-containing protein [Oricola sp.]
MNDFRDLRRRIRRRIRLLRHNCPHTDSWPGSADGLRRSLLRPGAPMEVMNMKKLFIALAAGLAVTAGAFAAQMEAVIQSVDADSRLVVLEDDSELTVAEGVDLSALEEGAAVMITVDDATNEITEIVVQ